MRAAALSARGRPAQNKLFVASTPIRETRSHLSRLKPLERLAFRYCHPAPPRAHPAASDPGCKECSVDDEDNLGRAITIDLMILCCSYAREWHEKLRELRESRAGLSLTVKTGPRSPERRNSERPEITIKPAFKLLREDQQTPLKVDPSGALNLSTGSPSPELSSPKSSPSPDTSQRISPSRSPQGYRPPSYTSVELCVVCGDRASGNSNPTASSS